MEDDKHCNPLQGKTVKDKTNGELKKRDEQALLFLDSLDSYLILLESLTSTLRQGWLELAGARHSMGPSRISSTLLDLKVQSAATTVIFNEPVEESPSVAQPQFRLSKWACLEERRSSPKEFVDGRLPFEDCISSQLTFRGPKHASEGPSESAAVDENIRALSLSENSSTTSESTIVGDVNKKRYKSLSVFGALVSPKLRAAQFSFETGTEWSFILDQLVYKRTNQTVRQLIQISSVSADYQSKQKLDKLQLPQTDPKSRIICSHYTHNDSMKIPVLSSI